MKLRTTLIRGILLMLSTVGIIVPVAVWCRPPGGYRLTSQTVSSSLPPTGPLPSVPLPLRTQFSMTVRGLGEMEADKKQAVTPSQARQLTRLFAPWGSRPELTDSEAKKLLDGINSALNPQQKVWLHNFRAQFPGGGLPAGGSNRNERRALLAFRNHYNPICRPEAFWQFEYLPQEAQQRFRARYERRKAILELLANKAKSAG